MLSERRKGDRVRMAGMVIDAVKALGAEAEIDAQWLQMCPREIMVRVTVGNAKVSIDFDGSSPQPDVHVCTWNLEYEAVRAGVRYSPAFCAPSSWPGAHHKASRVCYGIDAVLEMLRLDIPKIQAGAALVNVEQSHPHAIAA